MLIGDPALVLFGFSYYSLSLGLLWTPITSMFTHSGIAHLGGNMIFLFIYGFKLEERGYSGQGIYIAYIVTGLLASLLSAPLIGY
ncbi:MAG: rhomboid family intramembrane serine protease [Candidatus Kariarchaeaceae archaeon]